MNCLRKKFTLLFFITIATFASKAQVIITQYYEGASTNKWVELTNTGTTSINMASPQLRIGLWSTGGSTGTITFNGAPTATMDLTGTIAPGQTILIGNTGNGTEVPYLTAASAYQANNTVIVFNGNDGIALLDGSNNILDQFGLGVNAVDISYVRNPSAFSQSAVFNVSDWTVTPIATVQAATATDPARLGYHSASSAPVCIEPAAQPEDFNLTPTPTTITGEFTSVTPPADAYFVVRSSSPTLSASPVDGIDYTAGQAFGGGTVVGYYTAASFTDINLTPSTQYYYFVFALNNESCSGGSNYVNTNPLVGVATTPALPVCVAPSAAPLAGSFVFNNTNTTISGSFAAVPGANRYLVVISPNPTQVTVPVNGTTYAPGTTWGSPGQTVVSFGGSTSFIATGLAQNTTYYFFVYSANSECSGQPFYYIPSVTVNSTTTNSATGIPPGYYDGATSLTCQALKTALKTISGNGYVNIGYDGVYDAYQFTDIHRNDANTADIIWDMYSDNPLGAEAYTYTYGTNECGNYNSEADCYNREHSTPKSWFDDASPMFSDIQHLYPTDGWVNGKRSNFPYGEVTSASYQSTNGSKLGTGNNFGYTGTVFEPINAYKGDFARTSLYMATRYEDQAISQNWANNTEAQPVLLSSSDEPDAAKRRLQIYETWYLKLVFKWIAQDPVSQKEIDRNNAIYYQSGQHNRNPYVDHPEYAALVWQCTGLVPVTLTNFTATKYNESVILKWYATYETNFRRYDVERSTDGINFNKIGEVTGQNLSNYSFTDDKLPNASAVYYRLKMVDLDGKADLSKIAAVKLSNNFSNALVYPNPTAGDLNVRLLQTLSVKSTLIVTDISGRTVRQQIVPAGQVNIALDVKALPSGRYFIKIFNANQVINQSFVVIK